MSLAIVFPGQGSQSVGMLAGLAEAEPAVGQAFAEASDVLGYDLWQLCQQGPDEKLAETEFTQPAMLAAGIAAWRAWRERGGPAPDSAAGHSLGEYSALVASGAMAYGVAVELVRFRGQVMQRAVPAGHGAMAAILGLEDAEVEAACNETSSAGVVQPVNYNSPGQLVIAGERAAVVAAVEACKGRGAKRAVMLPVSVPSHSTLMQPAAIELRKRLAEVELCAPSWRVYSFDGGQYDSPASIRDGLYRQLFNPVRWSTIVLAMIESGITQMVECGPGKVLAGLARRIPGGRELALGTLDAPEALQAALAAAGVRTP